jgi:acid phosphatase type 7
MKRITNCSLAACFFVWITGIVPGLAAPADKLVGGPYVVNATGKAATLVWVIEEGSASIGTDPKAPGRSSPSLRIEKSGFTALTPGTKYFYKIDGRDDGNGSFKSAAAPGQPFDFVVFGDTRTRHDMHRRVVSAIQKTGAPDFVLHTGDLVADGSDTSQWPLFFDIERDLLRETVFFPSLGNHERNNRQFYDFFQVTSPYYSFDWGSAHFIVLNSDIGNVAADQSAKDAFWSQQRSWLEDDLAKHQDAQFRFVIAHHPPITAVAKRQGGNPQMTALVPMFEKYRLTAGFFGHDHNYQHYLKNGIHYVITGGGGAPLYDVDTPAAGITQKVMSTEHFVRIHIDNNSAQVKAISLDGKLLDEFSAPAQAKP